MKIFQWLFKEENEYKQCDGCGQDFKTSQLHTNNFFTGLYCDYCNEMEEE